MYSFKCLRTMLWCCSWLLTCSEERLRIVDGGGTAWPVCALADGVLSLQCGLLRGERAVLAYPGVTACDTWLAHQARGQCTTLRADRWGACIPWHLAVVPAPRCPCLRNRQSVRCRDLPTDGIHMHNLSKHRDLARKHCVGPASPLSLFVDKYRQAFSAARVYRFCTSSRRRCAQPVSKTTRRLAIEALRRYPVFSC